MRAFKALPIKRQLMWIILLTCGVVLFLACAAFVAYDQYVFRQTMADDLAILAEVVGRNSSGPLRFAAMTGPEKAQESLMTLQVKSNVLSAALYSTNAAVVAQYRRPGTSGGGPPDKPEAPGDPRFARGRLTVFSTVTYSGGEMSGPVGTIFLESSLDERWGRLGRFSTGVLVIMAAAFGLVILLSSKFQGLISEPLLELAKTARVVSDRKDYSVRAAKHTEGEIGFLIDQFNEMLAQIEQREKELEELNKQLAAATQAKSAFLASMSHELRTPLTAIIGFSEMLQAGAEAEGRQEQAEDLYRINDSAKHLLGLINGLLDLSKIEAGKMELHLEWFSVRSVVDEVANTVRPLVEKKSNRLVIDCPEEVGSIRSDLVKVRQCLFNLLGNANKFTERGVITLNVQRVTSDQWPVTSRKAEEQLVTHHSSLITFEVKDTGIGMTPEQLSKIFEAFTQADATTTRKYGGTGLGLAITRQFCQMMGGSIRAESELGKGSTFTLELPVEVGKPETVVRPTEPGARPGAPEDRHCILVIDDDPKVQRLIELTLKPAGYTVRFAADAKDGLRLARELHPAVITLDVLMPDMDGWSVLSALKAQPELANIPVIMLTIMEDRDLGFALGASEYLMKPIDRGQLLEVLKKYLRDKPVGQVLVVEDDAVLRGMLRRTLEMEKWTVTAAENGRVALERVKTGVPSVILLDLLMPVMDGFQFLAELHKREEWRQIPVVVITAKDLSQADRRRLVGQTEKVLEKGAYVREELVREVRKCVERFRSL